MTWLLATLNTRTASEIALRRVVSEGALVVGECVLAEIRPAFSNDEIEQFLDDWNIVFEPSTRESSLARGCYVSGLSQAPSLGLRGE